MALPFLTVPLLIKIGAGILGTTGVGVGLKGASDMKDAKDKMKKAQSEHENNVLRFEEQNKIASTKMDELGKKELETLQSFDKFSQLIEKIHNRPEFKPYKKDGASIPEYNASELKNVSIGAGVLLGGLGGAAMGTAGGFAAAGATTSAVMALGTASTGTAIASLTGAAATNATLAVLGGGTIAAGGGGMAAGTAALGAATLGVGLLIGGIIFSVTGSSLSGKADEALEQAEKAKQEIDKICDYLKELSAIADKFDQSFSVVRKFYDTHLAALSYLIDISKKTDWNYFSEEEQLLTQNTVLLVGLLYKMCQVKIVLKSNEKDGLNRVNYADVNNSILDADKVMLDKGFENSVG